MTLNRERLSDHIAGSYGLMKRSLWYPIGLSAIVLFWYLANKIWNVDHDLVNLLTFLSVEASLATSLVQRDQAKQEELIMKQLKYQGHILEALRGQTDKAN